MLHAHQILITDGKAKVKSNALEENIRSFRRVYHQYTHRLYDDRAIQLFLQQHFSKSVLNAYNDLAPFAFKADLARYCLLYQLGGVYSDISYLHLLPVNMPTHKNIAVFSAWGYSTPTWEVSNSLLLARPKQPIFKDVIARIVRNHQTRYLGESPLDVTGTLLLGRALAIANQIKDVMYGQTRLNIMTANGPDNIVKYTPNGQMVAYRNKKVSFSLSDFLVDGFNDYKALWESGRVWHSAS